MAENDNIEIAGLASIINSVKRELQQAHNFFVESSSEPKMLLRRMQIEISLIAEEKSGTDGKFDLKIVSLGTENDLSEKAVHRVTLDFDIKEKNEDGDTMYYHKKGG